MSGRRSTRQNTDPVPACFKVVNRKQRPYSKTGKKSDIKIHDTVYEIPNDYWCPCCEGLGCQKCKETGIRKREDRRWWMQTRN